MLCLYTATACGLNMRFLYVWVTVQQVSSKIFVLSEESQHLVILLIVIFFVFDHDYGLMLVTFVRHYL